MARVSRPVQTVTTSSSLSTGQETRATSGRRAKWWLGLGGLGVATAVVIGVWTFRAKSTPPVPVPELKTQYSEPSNPPTTAPGLPAASPAEPARDFANEKSLVVLPLENLSPDPDNAFFTDGIHSEIIANLSRIPSLKVISRISSLALKGSTGSLREIAKKVKVANVVSGSVRRAGNRLRIQLELRRASDEALLWSQDYDRELKDVFAIQSEIAGEVGRALQARESKGTVASARFTTQSTQAFDLFLRARAILDPLAWDGSTKAFDSWRRH